MVEVDTQLLIDYLKKHKLTKKAFCEQCHIGMSTLNNLLKNNANYLNAIVVYKLIRFTDINVDKLFKNKKA